MLLGSGVDLPVLLCEIRAVPGAVQLLWLISQLYSNSVSSRLLLLLIARITISVPAPPTTSDFDIQALQKIDDSRMSRLILSAK